MIKTPIYRGILQSDLELNGFSAGASGGGGGGGFQFDVTTFGAAGDGVTDDTTAIQAALAAIPATGGLLYFPAGIYKYTGATLALSKPVTVMGDGGGNQSLDAGPPVAHTYATPSITTIDFNSATGTLFTVTADGCSFRNIGLRNTSVTQPTAGAGILVSSHGDRTTYENVMVDGFYIDIDVQAGIGQAFNNCFICAPVLYGLKLRNILVPDGGDHAISNCFFFTGRSYPGVSAIRIESGGGVKIINAKIVFGSLPAWVNGVDLAVANNVQTVDLLISNCSFEGYSGVGIKGTTAAAPSKWQEILLTGNQFSPEGNGYAIKFDGTNPGDFNMLSINGNVAMTLAGSTAPMIGLSNCSNASLSANSEVGFSGGVAVIGSGVSFAKSGTIPLGGTVGQVLKKLSNYDYDVGWV